MLSLDRLQAAAKVVRPRFSKNEPEVPEPYTVQESQIVMVMNRSPAVRRQVKRKVCAGLARLLKGDDRERR